MAKTVILALAFGVGCPINYPIKKEVERLANLKGYPIFTQQDLGSTLELTLKVPLTMAYQFGDDISSLAVIRQFAHFVKLNGWTNVTLIAARQQIWRCARDLRRLLPKVYIHEIPVDTGYIPDIQRRVTSPLIWWSRELVVRALPWPLYQRLCG